MLTKEMMEILSSAKEIGWVLEPEAKHLFSLAGLDVPRFHWARTLEEALRSAEGVGYPLVGKIVSPKVLHKSERNGVVVGIKSHQELTEILGRFSEVEGFLGMIVEEMLSGLELMIGAKIDYQFGPVILLGLGGIAVEIYRDVSLRMAPLAQRDVESMVKCLKAHRLLEGYRGSEPVNLEALGKALMVFSDLVMDLEPFVESIDLNPVICSKGRCVVADARIMLKEGKAIH